jgi:ectoine hydroxylase-related dioxygenase (phytanoyl-CoA dioxygenase family)
MSAFDSETTSSILADFRRDGFAVVRGALDRDELTAIRDRTDELMEDPHTQDGYVENAHILRHANEVDRLFVDLLVREPIYSLMLAQFGDGMQQCGMNVLRSGRGKAIDTWHVDDDLFFPLPDDVPRHDSRIQMPVFWLTVQVPLSDIEVPEHGPTQYVPGSHYSGRRPTPDPVGEPEFEGHRPTSVFCELGDFYLHDPQCWHRGAPNDSDRVRYLLQSQYGVPWGFPRFNAYISHRMPDHLMEPADERVRGIIGQQRIDPRDRYRRKHR